MVNMKKIVGILLALCFVMSVTAATAAASGESHRDGPSDHGKPKFEDHRPKFNDHHKPKFEDHRPKFNDHHKKRHHHPAHWEKKRFGHRVWEHNHGHWQTVYVYKMVYIAESYDYHE